LRKALTKLAFGSNSVIADLSLRQDRKRPAFAERNKKLNAFLAGKAAGLQL
jgi:hypothetical protein